MGYFSTTLSQVVSLFITILIGYILVKKNLIPEGTDKALSRVLALVMSPCLSFKIFSTHLTVQVLSTKWIIVVYGLAAVGFSYIIGLIFSRFFAKDAYNRNIYTYSFTIANFGYAGYAIINSMFGEAMLFDMMVFAIPFNVFIFGVFFPLLTGHDKMSFEYLINPVFIAMIAGGIIGLSGIKLPSFISSVAGGLGDCLGPFAMLVTGMIIAKYDALKLLKNVRVYILAVLRMIVIPAVIVICFKLLHADENIIIVTLGTTAMSLGLNTIIYPASCGQDTTTGASMALISNIMGLVTIPLMFMLFL